ncbi:MAG: hypothetical protein ACPGLY_14865 [Rubripirellula sp.]
MVTHNSGEISVESHLCGQANDREPNRIVALTDIEYQTQTRQLNNSQRIEESLDRIP